MLGSQCDLKMHVRNLGFPLLLQIRGPKTTCFLGFRSLTANLAAYILAMKRDIHNQATALATIEVVSYIVLKGHQLWSTNDLKLDMHFCQPSTASEVATVWRDRNVYYYYYYFFLIY